MVDGVESNNTFKKNLGIVTKPAYFLYNWDYTPATFFITNPSNKFIGNVAAGSANYGFWFNFPEANNGLSCSVNNFPRNIPLGSFTDNIAHSNADYGLRIFPEFNPMTQPGDAIKYDNPDKNEPVTATFEGSLLYRNGKKGIEAEMLGAVFIKDTIAVDHINSGIEVSSTKELVKYVQELNDQTNPLRRGMITDCTIIGKSNTLSTHIPLTSPKTRGIVTPRMDNYLVKNIDFFNFSEVNTYAFGDCGRCEVSWCCTDSGARTIDVENIRYNDSVPGDKYLKWNYPFKGIFRDRDGSMSGYPSERFITPFYSYMLPDTNLECERNPALDDSAVCDASKVQIRRFVFYNQTPWNVYSNMPIHITQYDSNLLAKTYATKEDFDAVYDEGSIPMKSGSYPSNAWAVALVTKKNYLVNWGFWNTSPLNYNTMWIERGCFWVNDDEPLNIVIDYTLRRDQYRITHTPSSTPTYTGRNATVVDTPPFYTKEHLFGLNPSPTINFSEFLWGSFSNEVDASNPYKKTLTIHVDGKNSDHNESPSTPLIPDTLQITAVQCWQGDCGWEERPGGCQLGQCQSSSIGSGQCDSTLGDLWIEPGQDVILDPGTYCFNRCIIEGRLRVLTDQADAPPGITAHDPFAPLFIELKCKILYIKGGTLEVGNKNHPLPCLWTVKLTLVGGPFDENLTISNSVQLSNKILANLGELILYGCPKNYYSKLRRVADANQNVIKVAKNLGWQAGDQVIVGTTTHCNTDSEALNKIVSYDSSTGFITFENNLSHRHYGAGTANPTSVPDVDFADERADVLMVTRNIIVGADPADGWGATIVTTRYERQPNRFLGASDINNVEFVNIGQKDTAFSGMTFENVYSFTTSRSTTRLASDDDYANFVRYSSFHSSKYTAVDIKNSDSILMKHNVLHRIQQFGFQVHKTSTNVLLNTNFVMDMKIRETFLPLFKTQASHTTYIENFLKGKPFDSLNTGVDASACYFICPYDKDCKNVYLENNTCGGSEFLGFVMNGVPCGPLDNSENTAYSTNYGFILSNGDSNDCVKAGKMIAYNNYGWGVSVNIEANGGLVLNNVVSSNNLKGLILNLASSRDLTHSRLNNIQFIGMNPNNPTCYCKPDWLIDDEPLSQVGFMLSVTGQTGGVLKLNTSFLPFNKMNVNASWGSCVRFDNILFYNWSDKEPGHLACPFYTNNPSKAIMSYPSVLDDYSIHRFKNIKLIDVYHDN